MRKAILRWELSGFLFILVAGFPWHFVFEWMGGWPPAALFFPVNESIWEHMKLCFWPGLIWALVEYPFIGRETANFWTAKAVGLLVMCAMMAAGFYAYVGVVGRSVLWANLLDFAIATAVGQFASYRIITGRQLGSATRRLGGLLLGVETAAFMLLSFFPPPFLLFLDPVTRTYGLPQG